MEPINPEIGARLVELAGSPEFARVLLNEASLLSSVVEVFGYIVPDGREPIAIVSASLVAGAAGRVAEYIDRYFRMDPAVHDMLTLPRDHGFAQRVKAQKISAPDYRRTCFARPGFAEKLTYGWRGQAYIIVLSLYCTSEADPSAQIRLAGLANLGLAGMVAHHAPISRADLVETIERRLRRSFPALSQRETQVAARSLARRTIRDIALELNIGKGSAKTYLHRMHAKIGNDAREALLREALH